MPRPKVEARLDEFDQLHYAEIVIFATSPEQNYVNGLLPYSWHGIQEHRWFSQGITFCIVILVSLIAIALISFNN